ncbi:hypothetical protein, partial [Pseudoalteromonas sp. BZP1]|uniref:hypothetical protein n=1 Tax=Pseudoalteromonas sp. BZP1 TaxID=3136671 RepID=UPI0032C49AFB
MKDNNSKNYHSRLLDMSKAFDKAIEKLKDSYLDEKYSNWIIWLLISPFREYKRMMKAHEGLKKFSAESLTALVIPTAGIFTTGSQWLIGNISDLIDLVGAITIGVVGGYLFSILIYWRYILDFYSPHFHTGAYRVFRRQEYNMFRRALFDKPGDFYFQGVYDYLETMQTGSKEYAALSEKMSEYFEKEKTQLELKYKLIKSSFDRQERRHQKELDQVEEEYEALWNEYDETLTETLAGVEYIIELVKDINNVLFRMRNQAFSSRDLDLVSGFT